MAELGRLLTAMVTPYTPEGEVDYAHARRLAAHLVRSGNDGVVVTGTTGEAPLLTDEEKHRLWAEVKQELGDSGTVVAGAGTNDTRHSIHLSHEAERAGADAVLAVVPYYLKPPQEGIFQHPVTETIVCYLAALVVSAVMLWLFQREIGPWDDLQVRILILALPACVGGAAGRLAL